MTQNVKWIRDTLYRLKRDFGDAATLVQPIQEQTNTETGVRTVSRNVFHLPRVVILPQEMIRTVFYDLGFLKANNNFVYSGELDQLNTLILIDGRDVNNLRHYRKIELKDYIFYKNVRFEIERMTDLNFDVGYALALKTLKGELPFQPIEIKVQHSVYPYGGLSYEQN